MSVLRGVDEGFGGRGVMGWKLSWGALLLLFECEGLAFGGGEEWVL